MLLTDIAALELMVKMAVHDYHIYKEVWATTIGKEFVCHQEQNCVYVIIRCEVKWWNKGQ